MCSAPSLIPCSRQCCLWNEAVGCQRAYLIVDVTWHLPYSRPCWLDQFSVHAQGWQCWDPADTQRYHLGLCTASHSAAHGMTWTSCWCCNYSLISSLMLPESEPDWKQGKAGWKERRCWRLLPVQALCFLTEHPSIKHYWSTLFPTPQYPKSLYVCKLYQARAEGTVSSSVSTKAAWDGFSKWTVGRFAVLSWHYSCLLEFVTCLVEDHKGKNKGNWQTAFCSCLVASNAITHSEELEPILLRLLFTDEKPSVLRLSWRRAF